MKKIKKVSPIFEPILYIIISLLGICLIIIDLWFSGNASEKSKPFFLLISNIGIGIFPTGLIGFILVLMRRKELDASNFYKRKALLMNIDDALHRYINFLFEVYKMEISDSEFSYIVSDFLSLLVNDTKEDNITVQILSNTYERETEEIQILFKKIENLLTNEENYIVTQIFDDNELEIFRVTNYQINIFLSNLSESKPLRQSKIKVISCILTLLHGIPELKHFLNMNYRNFNIG